MTQPSRIDPVWIETDLVLAIHDRQLAEHGGGVGIRDPGALESALARPINKWSYGEEEFAALGAAYAFAVARKHPFVDGNKRTAWVAARLFLAMNHVRLRFRPEEAIKTMLALPAGELTEDEMADWFRRHIVQA